MSLHSSKWEESIWKYIENRHLNSKHLPGLEHWYQTHYINYIGHQVGLCLHREVKIKVIISYYLLSSIYKQFNATRENIHTDTFPFLSPSEMHLYSHLYTYFRKLSICNISKDLDRKLQAITSKVRTGLSFMSIKTVNLFIVKQNVWKIKF